MTTNYPVGDFLIRLKNAAMANKKELAVANTKLISAVAKALKEAGYLQEINLDKNMLNIKLAVKSKKPVLMDVKLVSKLGLRIYQDVDEIASHRGASILIVSTSKGVLTSNQAIKNKVGGEVIAEIW